MLSGLISPPFDANSNDIIAPDASNVGNILVRESGALSRKYQAEKALAIAGVKVGEGQYKILDQYNAAIKNAGKQSGELYNKIYARLITVGLPSSKCAEISTKVAQSYFDNEKVVLDLEYPMMDSDTLASAAAGTPLHVKAPPAAISTRRKAKK